MVGWQSTILLFRYSRLFVTPVKTRVQPHPLSLGTVSQWYEGPSPSLSWPEFIRAPSKGLP